MFKTNDAGEVQISSNFKELGERNWWYIHNIIHTSWFHVTYQIVSPDECSLRKIVFIIQLEHLKSLYEIPNIEIFSVDLVTPSYLNGTTNWQMGSLDEIWVADEPENLGQLAMIYKLKNGKIYISSELKTDEDKLLNRRLMIKI